MMGGLAEKKSSEKLLTISVAAYNMQPYIRQCLDSLVVPEILDRLEVFVVDDGGADGTLDIAREYEAKYPDTFHAVHKENGGYGSTVNYSLAHASGKYFKLLDGDDWLDTGGLCTLIAELEKYRNESPDLVLTRYYRMMQGCEPKQDNPQVWVAHAGMCFQTKDIPFKVTGSMWATVVKTAVLKGRMPSLPEHTLYTDKLFATYSMALSQTVLFLDFPVYCYRLGRDGQSVSLESRIRHYTEDRDITKEIIRYYCEQSADVRRFILSRAAISYVIVMKTAICCPASDGMYQQIKDLEAWLKSMDRGLYSETGKMSKRIRLLRLLRKCGYRLQAGNGPLRVKEI